MPDGQVLKVDKMGDTIVAIVGNGWEYRVDDAGSLINIGQASFYTEVDGYVAEVRKRPHEGYGRIWDLTTERDDYPFNDLDRLPVRSRL